jgi:crotonobetainyl-CoA:carnitine CoA-transferase CaiB-like acyl-CoA transferase
MIQPDPYWPKLCAAIERPDLCEDPRFENAWERNRNSRDLIAEIESTFARRTLDEWQPRLDAAGLIWAPVNTLDEAVADPQARAMGYFQELDHPDLGRFETVGPPFHIDGCDLGTHTAAASLGADTREVLREAGLSDAEIDALV